MTRAALLLSVLALQTVYARPKRRMAQRSTSETIALPEARHIVPSQWPRGIVLFVDLDYGLFGRGTISNMVKHHRQYAVQTNGGDLTVYAPKPDPPPRMPYDWEHYTMDEVWLLHRAGRWELIGKVAGRYFALLETPPRLIQKPAQVEE